MRAIGYVRVSRVGGREGDSFLSPELQRQSIARVCEREGLEPVEVLEELDRSGGDANRPLWNAVIERVERGAHVCTNEAAHLARAREGEAACRLSAKERQLASSRRSDGASAGPTGNRLVPGK